MTIIVEHSTEYSYPSTVALQPHTFRLRPRMTTTQRLIAFELQILPLPQGSSECLDQDGNLALRAWFNTPTQGLYVRSQFTVELIRWNPFDFLVRDESVNLALWYPQPLASMLAPYRDSRSVRGSVVEYAKATADEARWNMLTFLTTLNQRIFQTFGQFTRVQGPPWTSDLTLGRMGGSCRDLAVLFCDCCRVNGIAARFVSGYECGSAGRGDSYMHAWAEIYLPNLGWRGYDPSRGVVVADGHVAVAAAADPGLAAPVAGEYFGFGSQMNATLSMQVQP